MRTLLDVGLSNAAVASLLAVGAWGLGRVVRRPAVAHVLWLLVLLKLLTPPLWPVQLDWPAGDAPPATSSPGMAAPAPAPSPAATADGAPAAVVSSPAWTFGPERAVGPAVVQPPGEQTGRPERQPVEPDDVPGPASPVVAGREQAEPAAPQEASTAAVVEAWWSGFAWSTWLAAAWLAGSISWFALAAFRIARFQRLLRYGRPAGPALQAEADGLARRLGLAHCPPVWLVPGRVSPLLWALGGRARLVAPADLLEELDAGQQATLLAHELAHARRRDHWVRWLEVAVAGCYWWHPVVWWARHALHTAEEQCCDAWVVWALPQAARAYGKALLQTVEFLDARPAVPAVASGIGHVGFLKRRLTMIVRQPSRPWVPWPVQVAAVALGLFVLPLAPERVQAQPSDDNAPPDRPVQRQVRIQRVAQNDNRDREVRDLERRLDRLERQMERLTRALERQQAAPGPRGRRPVPPTPPGAPRQEPPSAPQPPAFPVPPGAKAPPGGLPRTPDFPGAPGKAPPGGLPRGAGYPGAPGGQPPGADNVPGAPGSPWGKPQMDQIRRQIQEAVDRAINPERMKALEREIRGAVDQAGLDPQHMKQLQDRIEQAVRQSFSPARMKDLQRRIESSVERALRDEERSRNPKPRAKPNPTPGTRNTPRGPSPDPRELERRLDRLEQKMDRLIDALQRRQQAPPGGGGPARP
jgi:beta-lactamase regulating signal transducer with metallopeptidase domain